MDLILVRHALPERSLTSADPVLAAPGRAQAARLAGWLAGERFDALYSSPMRRAIETAEPLRTRLGMPLKTFEGLAEYDRHSGAYIPIEELKRLDRAAWDSLTQAGGADLVAFRTSVVDALESIIAEHRGGRAIVFCHGGVINVWACHVLGLDPRLFFEPAYTSVHRFACSSRGHRSLVSLNETAHLRDGA
ncbi:MAG: histidine phosphatase family protein [Burkholderiaceae bacterium]|nr:histidine phosphatase family protein [Burkholderiaceae bacterium]